MLDGQPAVIEPEGERGEGNQNNLHAENGEHDDCEDEAIENACEDVELSQRMRTYSWSLRALRKLKICIITNTLKTMVK